MTQRRAIAHETRSTTAQINGARAIAQTLRVCGTRRDAMSSRVIRESLALRSIVRQSCTAFVIALVFVTTAHAQSPWERAASNLATTFTGPLARSLALVAIVLGGLMFMFGEGGAKRQISGIVFGGGLALFAGQFLTWLF
jgi:type IV secretory pathway VirB2 component (pilin)